MITAPDECTVAAAPVLALVRAAGVHGFTSEPHQREANAQTEPLIEGRDDEVLILIAKCGPPGFIQRTVLPASKPRPAAARAGAQVPRVASLPPVSSTRNVQSSTEPLAKAHPGTIVLRVPPGGDAALRDLETQMGRPFAGNLRNGAIWAERATADGGREIAFTSDTRQRLELKPLIGQLGPTGLNLSIGSINAAAFKRRGPGAIGRDATGGLPQLADASVAALLRVLG